MAWYRVITIEWRQGWCGGRSSQVNREEEGVVQNNHNQVKGRMVLQKIIKLVKIVNKFR